MNKRDSIVPPLLAQKLLKWFGGRADLEDLQGDLDEVYQEVYQQKGKLKAGIKYWYQVFSLIFSYGLKKRKSQAAYSSFYYKNSIAMFKNYLKVAMRNFAKQKLFTAINVIGLAMGMSVSLLILAILSQVLQFDVFHENKDQLYRITTTESSEDSNKNYATTSLGVYDGLKNDYPGIKGTVRINNGLRLTIDHRQNEIKIDGGYTDPSFFEVFSFDLAAGNESTALNEPQSIVLSQSLAQKLFPSEDPIGKVLTTTNGIEYTITGILKGHPRQTHLKYEALVSFSTIDQNNKSVTQWTDYTSSYVYVLMDLGKKEAELQSALNQLTQRAQALFSEKTVSFKSQAFTSISPGKNFYNESTPFDWLMTILLFCLGLLILIPACFNYTNLMIARALKRTKEIGIRKIVGSNRNQIATQFIVESILLSVIALIGSVFIFNLIKNEFASMVIDSDTLDFSLNGTMILIFILFAILTGVMAGLFPALYFSKLTPINSLKTEIKSKAGSISNIRKTLMVVQFAISLIFIIGVGVIAKQHKDILQYDLGFNKENVLTVPLKGIDHQLVLNEFSTVPGVTSTTVASIMPGVESGLGGSINYHPENRMDSIDSYLIEIDDQFLSVLDFKIKWGQNLNAETQNVDHSVLVNEEFMKIYRTINPDLDSLTMLMNGVKKSIVGVVNDFNFMQLNMGMQPLVIAYNPQSARYALMKVESEDIISTVDQLEKKWESIESNIPFESYFLDHKIQESYEQTFGIIKIFGFLGALSITISVIGLFGMVTYFTENRIKEVAIRKIMGASILNLYQSLGGSFMKLIVIATLIATPLAYVFYDRIFVRMISKFSVGVGWFEITMSILFMLIVGLLPILWMVSKIAKINPADNLRNE
ncbi:MAG: ABC transporter permease [Ekhidna sp.]